MEAIHLQKTPRDLNGTVECIREFALKNNLRVQELDEILVLKYNHAAIFKPSFNEIKWFYIPQSHHSLFDSSDNEIVIVLGSYTRFVSVSDITEQLLYSMLHHSAECCVCQEQTEICAVMVCFTCNANWCMDCQASLEGKEQQFSHYIFHVLLKAFLRFSKSNLFKTMEIEQSRYYVSLPTLSI